MFIVNNNNNNNNNNSSRREAGDGNDARVYEKDVITKEDLEFIYRQSNFGLDCKVFYFYRSLILGNDIYAFECKHGRPVWIGWNGMPPLVDFSLRENQPSFVSGLKSSIETLIKYMEYWNNDLFFNGVTTLKHVNAKWGEGWALFSTAGNLFVKIVE